MDPDFWHDRWAKNLIGFHQGEVNPHLRRYWRRLDPRPGETVLVPLCGKAHDLEWLREQGHRVVGVELSPVACRDFFGERGIEPAVEAGGRFTRRVYEGIEIWCGDVFDLTADDLGEIGLIYDRAALIALPEPMRGRYAAHLIGLSGPQTRMLLITLDYASGSYEGPPFAVSEEEVGELYSSGYRIERLDHRPLSEDDVLVARGAREGVESVFHLRSRS